MNARERFLATMRFQPVDAGLLWEWHYLEATIERWHTEGLPQEVYLPPLTAHELCQGEDWPGPEVRPGTPAGSYFGLDRGQPYCPGEVAYLPVHTGLLPPFASRVLRENEHTQVLLDADGVEKEVLRGVEPAMPRFLAYPVRARADFAAIQKRYDPASPRRYPPFWEEWKAEIHGRDYPLGLCFDGVFGRLRKWLGPERLMLTLYDDPAWFGEMCDFHTHFLLETLARAVNEVRVDYVNIWEDMAYKAGPLISPAHVRRYMLPGYRKVADLLRGRGVDILFVDCDGNIEQLIPIWLEAGINGVWPLEVAAGMDAVRLRQRYGRDLLLVGGIDKRELARDRVAVRAEVLRQAPHLNAQGGYIATVDHSVPPDVPFGNYLYLRELLRELAGR